LTFTLLLNFDQSSDKVMLYSASLKRYTAKAYSIDNITFRPFIYTQWPDTREFITRTVELWNRGIRVPCYYMYRTIV